MVLEKPVTLGGNFFVATLYSCYLGMLVYQPVVICQNAAHTAAETVLDTVKIDYVKN